MQIAIFNSFVVSLSEQYFSRVRRNSHNSGESLKIRICSLYKFYRRMGFSFINLLFYVSH